MSHDKEHRLSIDPRLTVPGQWLLLTKPKSAAYRGPSGRSDPSLLRKAEARAGFVAVYVVGERGGNQVRIGTATNPIDVFKTAQQWNWREIDVYGVLWAPDGITASNLKRSVERELSPFLIRGSWYELDPQMVINTVVTCAVVMGAKIFNDKKRYEIYERDIAEAVAKRALLTKQKAAPAPRPTGRIIPFEKTRR